MKTKSDSLMRFWAQVVKTRDKWTCQKCGRTKPWKLDAAHILSRGKAPKIKYLAANGITLCFTHHRWLDEHRGESDRWVREKVGEERYTKLLIMARDGPKRDLEAARVALKLELGYLERAG